MSSCKKIGFVVGVVIRVVQFSMKGYTIRKMPKNQRTQRKSLNFENWCGGEVSKVQNIWVFSPLVPLFLSF